MERHEHAVIDVASHLASVATGSSEGEMHPSDNGLAWLKWRVEEAWEPTVCARSQDFDALVRAMAREAIRMYEAKGW